MLLPLRTPSSRSLTAGLTVGTGLDKEYIERWREVPGCLVLLVNLLKRHGEVLLDGERGLAGEKQKGRVTNLSTATIHHFLSLSMTSCWPQSGDANLLLFLAYRTCSNSSTVLVAHLSLLTILVGCLQTKDLY